MPVAELQLRRGAAVGLVVDAERRPTAFVKTHAEGAYFARERNGLALANRVIAPRVRAPRLLETDEFGRRLVMEHVAGTPLRHLWRRRYWGPTDDDVHLAVALGTWLARYHALGDGPPDPAIAEAKAEATVEAIERAGRWLGARCRAAAIDLAHRLADQVAADGRPAAACHGDFTLGNVLAVAAPPVIPSAARNLDCRELAGRWWTPTRSRFLVAGAPRNDIQGAGGCLRVIDFGSSGAGLGETDLAAFRASLHTTLDVLPGGGRAADRLWSAFLDGYGTGWSRAALDLCGLYVLAHAVAEPYDFPSPAPPKRLWETYLLLRNVLRLRNWVNNRGCPISG